MHIHILGICGTFMGGLAIMARELGHTVTGSDANVYPPMSTQLLDHGIELMEGYEADHLKPEPDLVVVGNAMSRGNPAVEYMLDQGLRYCSGPQWLSEHALQGKWVLACSGTHGKTTTSSMLAWVLEDNGYNPGFLIGGVPGDFGISARITDSSFFVIEADEYDSAFFDKRSKFIHYRPRTLVMNNLEFDHADIFDDITDIQKQFHHVVRTVPSGNGRIIHPAHDANISKVIEMGCWSETETVSTHQEHPGLWQAKRSNNAASHFDVSFDGAKLGEIEWAHTGHHNMHNALVVMAAARHVGVEPKAAMESLSKFQGVKRRLELIAEVDGVSIYDDFAHHPTAIETTLEGLRGKVGSGRIVAIIEPRSNTMRMGVHLKRLAPATVFADEVVWFQPSGSNWRMDEVISASVVPARIASSLEKLVIELKSSLKSGDHVVIMSNGGFGGVHQMLTQALKDRSA